VSCRNISKLINLYLDGEANDHQKGSLFSHLETCGRCHVRLEESQKLHSVITSVSTVNPPANLRRLITMRIQTEDKEKSSFAFPLFAWTGITAIILIMLFSSMWHNTPKDTPSKPSIPIAKAETQPVKPNITIAKTEIQPIKINTQTAKIEIQTVKKNIQTAKMEVQPIKTEIQIVSPREDSVVEQQNVDISAALISDNEVIVQVILDGKDVTDATEVSKDFLIYTSDALKDGYHKVVIQVVDNKGISIARSWKFYVIGSEQASASTEPLKLSYNI
jgi:hypothetical protein